MNKSFDFFKYCVPNKESVERPAFYLVPCESENRTFAVAKEVRRSVAKTKKRRRHFLVEQAEEAIYRRYPAASTKSRLI